MKKGYKTEQKELIDNILNSGKDFSCDEIVDHLRENNTPVSLPTVYRRLSKLKEMGVVNSFYVGGRQRYKKAKIDSGSAILKCKNCGSDYVLNCDDLYEFSEHLKNHHHFEVDTNSIILYGLCKECLKWRK